MKEDTLPARAKREIVELHCFFQEWFRGTVAEASFSRLEEALAEDFRIVTPGGQILNRTAVLTGVRSQYGSDPEAELWIEHVSLRHAWGQVVVLTYEEWQGRHGSGPRGRASTVVFAAGAPAPNGLSWLHVHETWLPAQNGA